MTAYREHTLMLRSAESRSKRLSGRGGVSTHRAPGRPGEWLKDPLTGNLSDAHGSGLRTWAANAA